MKYLRIIKICLLLMTLSLISTAQYYDTGQDPSHIHWQQINTDNFQIIHPKDYEEKAQQLAQLLEEVYNYGNYNLSHRPKKISIVLHTHTTESNGMVTLAPRHSEFYPIPHQNMYGDSFLNQLAVHEFRHVVQIGKMRDMVPAIFRFLFGEHIVAAYFGFSLPWWFIEGDAVVTETALTTTGRGRFPPFLMQQKAQVVEKGVYSYDKAYNRSFKDFVPNHYSLGYYLVANAQKKWGKNLWNTVAQKADKKVFSFNPLNSALKDVTGYKRVKLYTTIFDSLQHQWKLEDEQYKSQKIEVLTQKQRFYTNYKQHIWLNDTVILAYKDSYLSIPEFTKINLTTKKEKTLHQPGWMYEKSINFQPNNVVWTESKNDIRWEHAGSSLMKFLDVINNKVTSIHSPNKLVAPAFSTDKNFVVSVETDKQGNNMLSIYNVAKKEKIATFSNEQNSYFITPIMIDNQHIITGVVTGNGFKLATIDLTKNKMQWLLDKTFLVLRDILYQDNGVYFVADYHQKMSLYHYDLTTKKLNLVYEPRFGLENPTLTPDRQFISFSNYTADGYQLAKIHIDKHQWQPVDTDQNKDYQLADLLSAQSKNRVSFDTKDSVHYVSKPYKKLSHLFKFHSWGPFTLNTDNYKINSGISFLSQNLLNTSFLKIGYAYDYSNLSNKYYIDYTYKGWYPIVSFNTNFENRNINYSQINNTIDSNGNIISSDTVKIKSRLNEYNLNLKLSLPLNLSEGRIVSYLQPSIQYNYVKYRTDKNISDKLLNGHLNTFSYRLFYSRKLKKSYLDVYPNWGYILDFNLRHAPYSTIQLANQWSVENIFFLPALMKNHGLRVYAGYQQRQDNLQQFGFSNQISYTQGWGNLNANSIANINAKYKLPLGYPDKSLSGLIYLRRLTAAFLYDCTWFNYNLYQNDKIVNTKNQFIDAVGLELIGDVNFFRFYAPAQLGVRTYYLPQKKNFTTNLILLINFEQF